MARRIRARKSGESSIGDLLDRGTVLEPKDGDRRADLAAAGGGEVLDFQRKRD
jgi:hypothetical protein